MDNFFLRSGVDQAERLSNVVPAALDGSAKLWWWFIGASHAEFTSINFKFRLKEELEQRTQHPKENLKEFIYMLSANYNCIKEQVTDKEKVQRVPPTPTLFAADALAAARPG